MACVVCVAVVAVGGCAAPHAGNGSNNGYTNDVADLLVKVPALRGDPCRGAQAGQIFANCGRYVTEIANTVAALRADLPGQGASVDALQTAVTTYQRNTCDSAGSSPTAVQARACPAALTTIGVELDRLGGALAAIPTSK
jgi:hypothetical protein